MGHRGEVTNCSHPRVKAEIVLRPTLVKLASLTTALVLES